MEAELRRRIEKLEDELTDMEVLKNDMLNDRDKFESQADDLEAELSDAENIAADLEVERDDLRNDLSIAHAKIDVLEGDVKRITAQRNEANGNLEKLWRKKDAEIAELQAQVDGAMMVLAEKGEEKI